MAEKRVSVRLAATGGRQVRSELEGVGEAGKRGFGRLSQEMEAANRRLAGFARRVRVAAAAAVAAATAAGVAMLRSGLQTVDAQAKLAASLDTTVASIQVLERAGEMAGVSMGQVEQATVQLTRRLSQAASGTGPAVEALRRLRLSAEDLQALPLDARIATIQEALGRFVPEAERAAVASQLFGDRAALVFGRIDTDTLRQATRDVRDFGVVVSDQDAAQIERTNDAISRLGLIWRGLSNQLAVAAAPALEAVADAMAAVARTTGPLGQAIRGLFDNLGRLASIAASFAAFMAGRWVAGLAAAALSVRGLATALVVLRGALIRTGIGALIVGAGELIHWFTRLAGATGRWSEALSLMGAVGVGVFRGLVSEALIIPMRLGAVWADMQAGFIRALANMTAAFGDFIAGFETFADMPAAGPLQPLVILGQTARGASLAVDALNRSADAWTRRAEAARDATQRLSRQGWQPMHDALARIRAILAQAAEGSAEVNAALSASLREIGDALESTADAARGAGRAQQEADGQAAEGWARVLGQLYRYRDETMDVFGQIGGGIVNAFRGAENALGEFVRTGKLRVSELARAIIADFAMIAARQAIFGPLSNALMAALGGFGGGGMALASLPRFETGDHAWPGARSAGLDGRGGRLAMLRPNESVIGHTRGGGTGSMTVNVINNARTEIRTQERQASGGKTVDVIIDELVGEKIGTPGSAARRALQANGGVRPQLARR